MLLKKIHFLGLILLILLWSMALKIKADTIIYSYDSLNRLVRVEYSECDIIEYTYDPAGNRMMQVVQSCPKFVISGYVRDSDGLGIAAVVLNGLPGNPTTEFTGFYSTEVEPDWSGAVIPQKGDYTFTPAERSYENLATDQSEQNYTGVLKTVPPDPTETPTDPIPEPTMLILFVTGLLGFLGLWRWKKRRTKKF